MISFIIVKIYFVSVVLLSQKTSVQ